MRRILLLGIVLVLIMVGCQTPYQQLQEQGELQGSTVEEVEVDTKLTEQAIKKEVSCPEGYMPLTSTTCCKDRNDNEICDEDENKEEGCSDECSSDICKDFDYIECLMKNDGCKDTNVRGQVKGKCGVECTINNDCDSDKECKNYKCSKEEEDFTLQIISMRRFVGGGAGAGGNIFCIIVPEEYDIKEAKYFIRVDDDEYAARRYPYINLCQKYEINILHSCYQENCIDDFYTGRKKVTINYEYDNVKGEGITYWDFIKLAECYNEPGCDNLPDGCRHDGETCNGIGSCCGDLLCCGTAGIRSGICAESCG